MRGVSGQQFEADRLSLVPVVLFLLTFTSLGSVWDLPGGLAAIEIAEDEGIEGRKRGAADASARTPPESFYGRWLRSYGGWDPGGARARQIGADRRGRGPRGGPGAKGGAEPGQEGGAGPGQAG